MEISVVKSEDKPPHQAFIGVCTGKIYLATGKKGCIVFRDNSIEYYEDDVYSAAGHVMSGKDPQPFHGTITITIP